uniref:SMP-30/Gluconolactonase/LRE-like region domain-containing protein n=1 Tax=Amorphochlora amoebiformis TaxID=1561963 RepID=A0A7S0H088_9EUKA
MQRQGYLQENNFENPEIDEEDGGIIERVRELIGEGVVGVWIKMALKIPYESVKDCTASASIGSEVLAGAPPYSHSLPDPPPNSEQLTEAGNFHAIEGVPGHSFAEIFIDTRTIFHHLWQLNRHDITFSIIKPNDSKSSDGIYKAQVPLAGLVSSSLEGECHLAMTRVGGREGLPGQIEGRVRIGSKNSGSVSTFTYVTERKKIVTGYDGKTTEKKKATFIWINSVPIDIAIDPETKSKLILETVERGMVGQILVVGPKVQDRKASARDRMRAPVRLPEAEKISRARAIAMGYNGQVYVSRTGSILLLKVRLDIQKDAETGEIFFPVDTWSVVSGIQPLGITVDHRTGRVFVVDGSNAVVKELIDNTMLKTVSPRLYDLRNVPQGNGTFYCPYAIAVDSLGRLVVASINTVQRFWPGETDLNKVETLANRSHLNATFYDMKQMNKHRALIRAVGLGVGAVDGPGGDESIVVSDSLRHALWKIGCDNRPHIFAGKPPQGASFSRGVTDGPVGLATFNMPAGLAVDPDFGTVYVTEMRNHRVRRISAVTRSFLGGEEIAAEEGMSDEDAVPLNPDEGKYDPIKMRPDDWAHLMRRRRKPEKWNQWSRLKRRKQRKKEAEDLGFGYVNLPDEIRKHPTELNDMIKPGKRWNEELGRLEEVMPASRAEDLTPAGYKPPEVKIIR